MGYANQHHNLLLTTGNKSELAMGYCTLYGDMAGGFNLLGDLLKTQVYELAHYINKKSPIIPLAASYAFLGAGPWWGLGLFSLTIPSLYFSLKFRVT